MRKVRSRYPRPCAKASGYIDDKGESSIKNGWRTDYSWPIGPFSGPVLPGGYSGGWFGPDNT